VTRSLLAIVLITAGTALGEPPAAVMDTLRTATEALADADAAAFLDHFDPATPNFQQIRTDVEALLASGDEVSSTLEPVSDDGKDNIWNLELDWLLRIGGAAPRRALVKVRLEKQGRAWKFTRLDPSDFFRR
jgi:hypothetical protein